MGDKQKTQYVDQGLSKLASKSSTQAEVNFLVLPYFCLDKEPEVERSIEFREIQQRGNERIETVWTVLPHSNFGLPRDFERRLQRTIEHSLSSVPRPISNPVPLPGFRELARMMGVTYTGRFAEKVKRGFTVMMMTGIISKRSYYNKRQKKWTDERFHLYDKIIFKGERLSGGQIAEVSYAYFTSGYMDNLNSMYVRPIDFEYLKSLKPIASRLYEILGVKFYGHRDFIQYKYSTLCWVLPLKRQKTLGLARQQFDGAHEGLKRTGFLRDYGWIEIKGVKYDWYVRYVPGERFFNEIRNIQALKLESAQTSQIRLLDESAEFGICPDGFLLPEHESVCGASADILTDPPWCLFAGIVAKYPEFDLRDHDQEWFRERIQENSNFPSIDLMYEIQNWGDWLDLEHRKKIRKDQNRFPRSNFKGSLMNWIQHSLRAAVKGEIYASRSAIQNKPGRKGFDLPSDYPIDVM